ncbi:MAG: hypothetical protein FH761_15490 [Firmicutes bacterium]|nr:hypothetical protein [Bacillota bacterium]
MAFSNQSSSIVTDSKGNLYFFLWTQKGIELVFLDKIIGNTEKKILVEDCYEDFDVIVDSKDKIHLIYQKKDGNIENRICSNGIWKREEVVYQVNKKAFNLKIRRLNNKIHIFYCVPKNDNNKVYNRYHAFKLTDTWETKDVGAISRLDILNTFEIQEYSNSLFWGYFDLVKDMEQLYIQQFDIQNNRWIDEIQITSNQTKKLYLDFIILNDFIHITYCENFMGNYVVKYEKYEINVNQQMKKVNEEIVSNPSNCSYPTFVVFQSRLWIIWTELENLMSVYSEDMGDNWNEPYLWSESKQEVFTRYRFDSNERSISNTYTLNYSFGKQYPNISFMGFGKLDKAVEVPLKYKKNDIKMDIEQKFDSENNIQELEQDGNKEEEKKESNKDIVNLKQENLSYINKWPKNNIKPYIEHKEKNKRDDDMTDELKEDIRRLQKDVKDINDSIKKLKE